VVAVVVFVVVVVLRRRLGIEAVCYDGGGMTEEGK
jgi:hypothetical protein